MQNGKPYIKMVNSAKPGRDFGLSLFILSSPFYFITTFPISLFFNSAKPDNISTQI